MLADLQNIKYLDKNNLFIIAGPCVIESYENALEIAEHLNNLSDKYQLPFIFKGSFTKANRTRYDSFQGIGDEKALEILAKISQKLNVPVLTDIHTESDAKMAAKYVDVLQIPAFLARQTSLLQAAAATNKYVNIKKGQFMSPEAMHFAAQKVSITGNTKIMLTERGTMFGYGDLIVDFRGIPAMKSSGYPVITDITHSLQQPNTSQGVTGGKPELIELMGRTAIAAGTDGIFFETHPNPAEAKSDGANMLSLDKADRLLKTLLQISNAMKDIELE